LARARALCDIRDGDALARWFQRERPDIVFHVAALKHVPMVEEFVCEGVLTNVLGTRNVAQAAAAVGAHMLFVSTDKAANPTGAMGATKRAAEMLCQAFDRAGRARFMIARLGNVLGSTGSVTPMFERQIAAGGPVTVTDPEVARYFITIPQAADFILRALAVGVKARAPRGAALVLDMGDPIPVIELARDMILLHGQRPEEDVEIKIVGLRPGEKLIEQLIDENEAVQFLTDEGMMAAHAAPCDLEALNSEIDALVRLARAGHDEVVRERLMALAVAADRAQQPDIAAAG
jgi:O-antigen biosynthesis protein WbqV